MSASRERTNPNDKRRAGNDRAWVFFTKEEHRPEGQSAEHNGASVSSRWDPSNRHQEFKPTKMEGGQNKNMRTGAWSKGAATGQITRRDRAGNVKVPAASRRVDSRGRLAVTCPPREDQRDHNVSACL